MFKTNRRLILASASPRRRDFFTALGLKFSICPAALEEVRVPAELPNDFVMRMAREKAVEVGDKIQDAWIVAADTIVVCDEEIFGKPASKEEALIMLNRLAGREHEVYTGYCLFCLNDDVIVIDSVTTRVRFLPFNEDIARAYVRSGEPMDKAGAYGIQGKGSMLVASIDGSCANVVGLPVAQVMALLLHYEIISPLVTADDNSRG